MISRHRLIQSFMLAVVSLGLLTLPQTTLARGKGFKEVVQHIERNYRAKKVRIPMLGLANFAVKLIRPAGVKGFKVAVFADQDFAPRASEAPMLSVMRQAYLPEKGWKPLVQIGSKREGNSRIHILFKENKKDVEVVVTTLGEREAAVIQAKFSPDKMAEFISNPRLMGISLGKSVGSGASSTAPADANTIADESTIAAAGTTAPPAAKPRHRDEPIARSGDTIVDESLLVAQATRPSAPNASGLNAPGSDALSETPSPASDTAQAFAPTVAGSATKQPNDAVTGESSAIRIETRLVNLNVKALSKGGQPLTTLQPADFIVLEDGVPQAIDHFKPVNAPVNLVVMLDLSGSTNSKRKAMIEAARKFIDVLPARDKMAIVAFTRRYRVLARLTNDKLALKSSLEKIKGISGGTSYYDAMWQAFDDLDRVDQYSDDGARKAIVVLTDGEDESLIGNAATDHSFDQLLRRASEEDVTVYPIYFKGVDKTKMLGWAFGGNLQIGGPSKDKIARQQLEQIAEQTGGELINAQNEEALAGAYERVAQELHSLYSLAYAPDKLKHDGGFRKIAVQVKQDGALARTRKGYYDK